MTPSLLAALLPALRRLRCVLPGFNVTPERGAHALLAAALAPPGALRGDRKYVLRAGALEAGGAHVPCGEQWPASDQERMLAACGAWEARWREKAGEAAEEPQ